MDNTQKIDIDYIYDLNKQVQNLTRELNAAKAQIKEYGIGSTEGQKYVAVVSDRVSTKLDEEECLTIVKKHKLKWLLKETVDMDKLEDDIASGTVDAGLFASALREKHTMALTFRKRRN